MSNNLKKKLFILLIFVLIFLGICFTFVIPTTDNIIQNKKILAEKQVELIQLSKKVDVLLNTSKHPEEFSKISNTASNYWPQDQDVSKFIVQTEGLANSKGTVIENLSIAPQASKKKNDNKKLPAYQKFDSVQFSFSIKSNYDTLKDIIENMETLARYNILTSISLNLDEEGLVSTNITGNIFYGL